MTTPGSGLTLNPNWIPFVSRPPAPQERPPERRYIKGNYISTYMLSHEVGNTAYYRKFYVREDVMRGEDEAKIDKIALSIFHRDERYEDGHLTSCFPARNVPPEFYGACIYDPKTALEALNKHTPWRREEIVIFPLPPYTYMRLGRT